jgi:hypothetical protein
METIYILHFDDELPEAYRKRGDVYKAACDWYAKQDWPDDEDVLEFAKSYDAGDFLEAYRIGKFAVDGLAIFGAVLQ